MGSTIYNAKVGKILLRRMYDIPIFQSHQKNQTVDLRNTSARALIVPTFWSTMSVQKA